ASIQARFGAGFLGRIATALAVDDRPRRSTEVWAQGAVGEQRVAAALDRLAEAGVVALHDRRVPGTRGNIDHIAITPWGVWVVDAKRYVDKRPDVVMEGGFLSFGGTRRLTVGGRKKDELVDGVLRQVERVRAVVDEAIPVRGALVFVDADWPLIGGHFTVRGVAVLWPRRIAKLMLRQEPPTVDVGGLARRIAASFPPA
ncbi:nuclease-related domain-containing protein, partial [Mesorhizobium japonicum]|uniref:nuclease-related domain-containing protein n=1 Tax=Mesorhizobium japonicum TaxID=2066070 RepID=UPI003B596BD8